MVSIDPRRLATTLEGRAELVAERDRRAANFAAEQERAAQHHQVRLRELAATGRPISSNFTGETGIANLAAEDAVWAPGAGLERIARMEYDLAPGVRQMDAAQLREFVESGRAAQWRAGELISAPAPANDPFGGLRAPAFEEQLGYGIRAHVPAHIEAFDAASRTGLQTAGSSTTCALSLSPFPLPSDPQAVGGAIGSGGGTISIMQSHVPQTGVTQPRATAITNRESHLQQILSPSRAASASAHVDPRSSSIVTRVQIDVAAELIALMTTQQAADALLPQQQKRG